MRTAGNVIVTRWLFPGYHPGKHLDAQSNMMSLRWLGSTCSAPNPALGTLVAKVLQLRIDPDGLALIVRTTLAHIELTHSN